MSRAKGRLDTSGHPARLLDHLETDGGWLTSESLALLIGASKDSVDRALWRLKERGLIEKRSVGLASARLDFGGRSAQLETRGEWRFITWGDWSA